MRGVGSMEKEETFDLEIKDMRDLSKEIVARIVKLIKEDLKK
jgi:hypothetical protein